MAFFLPPAFPINGRGQSGGAAGKELYGDVREAAAAERRGISVDALQFPDLSIARCPFYPRESHSSSSPI